MALIFDGAGTRWIGELWKPDHRYHRLYEAVRDVVPLLGTLFCRQPGRVVPVDQAGGRRVQAC